MDTTPTSTISVIVGLVLGIAGVTVTVFAAQVGAQWVKEVTDVALLISLAFHIPVVQTTASSILKKKIHP